MCGAVTDIEKHAVSDPIVSIILPTFNRASFLPEAFESIRSQSFSRWELIVVDDGSTDDTRQIVQQWVQALPPSVVRYVHQENQGAYGARNTGLSVARGAMVAFFDSDDIWISHHLERCVEALEANPDVDWVYAACRVERHGSDRPESANTFYVDGRPRPFLRLHTRHSGPLRIIQDRDAVRCLLLNGFYCGPQNSVVRRRVFDKLRFSAAFRNEAEDRVMVLRALTEGFTFGYIDDVHVVYRIHDSNSSASSAVRSVDRSVSLIEAMIRGYEDVRPNVRLTPAEQRAFDQKLAAQYFWQLGYSLFWLSGRRSEALRAYRKGLGYWPWSLRCWKTYLLALFRSPLGVR